MYGDDTADFKPLCTFSACHVGNEQGCIFAECRELNELGVVSLMGLPLSAVCCSFLGHLVSY